MMLPEIRRGLTVARCLSGEGLSFRWAPCVLTVKVCVTKTAWFCASPMHCVTCLSSVSAKNSSNGTCEGIKLLDEEQSR